MIVNGHKKDFADKKRSSAVDRDRNQAPKPTESAVLPHSLAVTEWSTETTKY